MRHTLAVVVGLPTLAIMVGWSADEDNLTSRLDRIEREIGLLRSGSDALDEQRRREIVTLVGEALADADARSSLLADGGGGGGWDNGFFLESPDGAFRLEVSARLQVRYVYNSQEGAAVDHDRTGFDIRRMYMEFQGHVVDPSWQYLVGTQLAGGSIILRDATITKDLGDGWAVQAGRFKLPFMAEALVSSKRLLAVDRSLIHQAWTLSRSNAAMITKEWDRLKVDGAVSNGAGLGFTPAIAEDTEWALTGRVEALIAGSWKQFSDFTGWRGDDFGLKLGAAGHWQVDEYGTTFDAGTGTGNDDEVELMTWTADAAIEGGGWNLLAALVGRHSDSDAADLDQYAAFAQGGAFVADSLELFARYEWGDDDTDADDLGVATIGFNRYFDKQRIKWTSDFGYGVEPLGAAFTSGSAGWREDEPGEDGQFVIRSQLQLYF